MIRRELAIAVADNLDLPATTIRRVLDTALALVIDQLLRAGRLEWRGLGTFTIRSYPARQIHVPATGKTVTLPARKSVTFKPGVRLRSKLRPPKRVRRPRSS